jgi:hypothetical protein
MNPDEGEHMEQIRELAAEWNDTDAALEALWQANDKPRGKG